MKCDPCCPPHHGYVPKFPKSFTITPGWRQYPNPGNVANLHKKTRDIMPQFFDGIKFSYRKNMAPNKTLTTSWILSHIYPSGFRIGGVYHCKMDGNVLETPIIEADINPSTLSSNFSVLYYPLPSLRLETKFQRLERSKICENTMTIEHVGRSSTLTLNAYNANSKSGRVTVSYLRSITEMFSAGSEILLEWCNNEVIAKTAFAAKYGGDRFVLATTVSPEALDISYWRQIHKSIQLGTSLAFNHRTQKAIGSFYYQWEFRDAFVRGMVDSDWSVGFMYNRSMCLLPCTLGVSLLFCVPNTRFAFGLTLDLDPSLKYES